MSRNPFAWLKRWNRGRLNVAARGLFRLCLAACPDSFREKFGSPLVETFQDQLDEALRRAGWSGWLSCLFRECLNLLFQATRLRGGPVSAASWQQAKPNYRWQKRNLMQSLFHDLRGALRVLIRHPGSSLGVVILLSLGIALNTASFSIFNSYLLRPLPFPDSDRLVSIRTLPAGAPATMFQTVPRGLSDIEWPIPEELAEEVVSWDLDVFTLVGDGRPEVVPGAWILPSYLRALGVRPVIGRSFDEADGQPGAAPVAMIDYEFWQRRFGGDPAVLGKTLSAFTSDRPDDAENFTIVGVLPARFWFINEYHQILTNLTVSRTPYLMKLREGVENDEVADYLNSLVRDQIETIDPAWPGMSVAPLQEVYVEAVRPSLVALFVAATLVLLIACGNVAMLLTVRALGRQRELSIRRALGASRLRIGRELCLEGACLALLAGIIGLALASGALHSLGPSVEVQLRTPAPGGVEALRLGGIGVLASLLLSGFTAVLFACIPALVVANRSLARALTTHSLSASDTPRQQFFRNLVVGVEIALSLILLVAASLMLQSTFHLYREDLGLNPENVVTAGFSLRQANYAESRQLTDFASGFLDRARTIPGITSAAISWGSPLHQRRSGRVEKEADSSQTAPSAGTYVVSDDYFRTLQIPLLQGREFGRQDHKESLPVVIVSESLARSLWSDREAIGRQVRLALEGENAPWRTIVGVSRDVVETLTAEPLPDVYIPYDQSPLPYMTVIARVQAEPSSVISSLGEILRQMDPMAAITDAGLLELSLSEQRRRPQFLATLLTGFTLMAILLALVGLSTTVSYAVNQRRRDVAIRMALGATRQKVVAHFLGRSFRVVTLGAVGGLLGSRLLSDVLAGQLHGISSSDLLTTVASSSALCLASLLAVWLPARRASSTNPVEILKR